MQKKELNRERRKQRACERLGTNEPRCPFCGVTDPLVMELHHVGGRAFDDTLVPICRNCHRILTDWQKDHPTNICSPPNESDRIGHALIGLADMFELLGCKLREHAAKLIAATQITHSRENQS
jgi:hypothetical protein